MERELLMARGLDVVKQEIVRHFGHVDVIESPDFGTKDTILDFTAEQQLFSVQVTHEFDTGYASGQIKMDFRPLGGLLRASPDHKVVVMRSGIKLRTVK